jgi:predicted ester cyclase
VAGEDNVAFAYTITGKQGGPFNGIPATGKKIKVRGMQISKFNSDSKLVERWGASHEDGILQQIGAIKPVPHFDEPPVLSAPVSARQI